MNRVITSFFVLSLLITSINAKAEIVRRVRPDAHSKPSGGIVEKPYSGNIFLFANAQAAIPHKRIASFAQKIRLATIMPFEASEVPLINNAYQARRTAIDLIGWNQVGASVVIVDITDNTNFINSEEGNWAILNIAFLKTDNPTYEKLEERVAKALWLAAGRVLGAGYSGKTISVLKPFHSLDELDSNKAMRPSPEGFNAMLENGERLGIKTITISSYRTACRNGWAPAPTNDIQKAIWNEFNEQR